MITSPQHQNKTEKTGGKAASITKHLSNDCLRSSVLRADIGLKHPLMDDLKRQMMAEDDVYSYSDDEQLAGMGCAGRIFKINADARISRSNFSCLC